MRMPTGVIPEAGPVKLAHVKVQADNGEHEDRKKQQHAYLQQGHHGFHNGFQHHLGTWHTETHVQMDPFTLAIHMTLVKLQRNRFQKWKTYSGFQTPV